MSKITAEIEIKQARVSDAVKGVARSIDRAFAPLKRGQVAMGMLGRSLSPLTSVATAVAGGVALVGSSAIVAGGAMALGVKKALDLGGTLSDLEAQTGATAGALMVTQQAFVNNGLSADKVGPVINRLQKALAGANEDGDATTGIFAELGLSMDALRSATPDQQLAMVGQAIAALEDPTARTAAAMQIFGKSGGELQALFSNASAFTQASSEVGKQAGIMDRNAALFDDISDKLNLASLKMQGFFVGVADYVAPVIQPLLDWFASQDLAAQGQQFGLYLATAIQMLTDGTLGEALKATLQLAALNFVNTITAGINDVISALSSVPGFGGVADLQISPIDTSALETQLGTSIVSAMDRVEAARQAADALVKKPEQTGVGEGSPTSGGASKGPSISRLFSTTSGLFVKDQNLAEARKSNQILERIEKGILNLATTGVGKVTGGTQLRFT